jgi:hypothetical protein
MDLYEISKFFRENTGKNNKLFRNIFRRYGDVKITNSELNDLREDFFLLKIKSKLEVFLYKFIRIQQANGKLIN